jgi:hypothetical protein
MRASAEGLCPFSSVASCRAWATRCLTPRPEPIGLEPERALQDTHPLARLHEPGALLLPGQALSAALEQRQTSATDISPRNPASTISSFC